MSEASAARIAAVLAIPVSSTGGSEGQTLSLDGREN